MVGLHRAVVEDPRELQTRLVSVSVRVRVRARARARVRVRVSELETCRALELRVAAPG